MRGVDEALLTRLETTPVPTGAQGGDKVGGKGKGLREAAQGNVRLGLGEAA